MISPKSTHITVVSSLLIFPSSVIDFQSRSSVGNAKRRTEVVSMSIGRTPPFGSVAISPV